MPEKWALSLNHSQLLSKLANCANSRPAYLCTREPHGAEVDYSPSSRFAYRRRMFDRIDRRGATPSQFRWLWDAHATRSSPLRVLCANRPALPELRDDNQLRLVCSRP